MRNVCVSMSPLLCKLKNVNMVVHVQYICIQYMYLFECPCSTFLPMACLLSSFWTCTCRFTSKVHAALFITMFLSHVECVLKKMCCHGNNALRCHGSTLYIAMTIQLYSICTCTYVFGVLTSYSLFGSWWRKQGNFGGHSIFVSSISGRLMILLVDHVFGPFFSIDTPTPKIWPLFELCMQTHMQLSERMGRPIRSFQS